VQESTLMARPFDPQLLEFRGKAVRVADKITMDSDAGHAVFSVSANGVLLYHAAVSRANSKLEWFDREEGSQGSLGETAGYVEVHLSPDNAQAAVSLVSRGARELWIYEIARNIRTRFTFGSSSWVPSWSPDGSELVFTSIRNGRYGLYRKSLGGPGEERLLIDSEGAIFPEGWSPDGKLLAFDRQSPDTSYDVWILPLYSEREPYPFVQTEFEDAGAAFSPDGQWLAYQSNEKGRWEVYVTPFPGPGRKWQVSTGGGAWPRWREDGAEIFYHGLNGQLMAVEVAVRDDTFVVGAAEALFAMGRLGNFYTYAATQDGQRFLVVSPERREESSPLTLVLNWTAELDQA
jgi:Tol biopolymer transport system component